MTPSNTPTSCPDRNAWAGFYSGKLTPDELLTLADHLDQCTVCQAVLETMEDAGDELIDGLRANSGVCDSFRSELECMDAVSRVQALASVVGSPTAKEQGGRDPNSTPLPVPGQLGEYRILEVIGRGGMGTVCRAIHARLGREVALKVLPRERADDAAAVARFHREMAALGKLDHPNVVRATDAGMINGVAFLVMDLVEGIDLGRLTRARGRLEVADACEVIRQSATGLQHLAGNGLVHRDVKPSNLMLSRRGEVKLLDLGLALADRGGGDRASTGGRVVGTYDYLAPEQADPALQVDPRADIYALGCTLYHLLAGKPPYGGPRVATIRDKLLAHSLAPVPEVRDARPDVPPGLAAVLRQMLAKEPNERFSSPAEVAAALAPYCPGSNLPGLLEAVRSDRRGSKDPRPPISGDVAKLSETISLSPWAEAHSRRRRPRLTAAAALLAVLLLGGGLTAGLRLWGHQPGDTASQPPNPNPPEPDQPDLQPIVHSVPPEAPDQTDLQEVIQKKKAAPKSTAYPAALFVFEESSGAKEKDLGRKVTDLLFAKLVTKPAVALVDRADLKKVLDELALSTSGAVRQDEAAKAGQLVGAKLLIMGSVIQLDKNVTLSAKIISAETSLSTGASVKGLMTDDLDELVGKLANEVATVIEKRGAQLVPMPVAPIDSVVVLNKALGKTARPAVFIKVDERHVGMVGSDPAVQTELSRICTGAGFAVVDTEGKADVVITGAGFSETASRVGPFASVRARVELTATDRKLGKVLTSDRQTIAVVDLTEQIAGKQALQEAAATLAERVLPKLVKPPAKK